VGKPLLQESVAKERTSELKSDAKLKTKSANKAAKAAVKVATAMDKEKASLAKDKRKAKRMFKKSKKAQLKAGQRKKKAAADKKKLHDRKEKLFELTRKVASKVARSSAEIARSTEKERKLQDVQARNEAEIEGNRKFIAKGKRVSKSDVKQELARINAEGALKITVTKEKIRSEKGKVSDLQASVVAMKKQLRSNATEITTLKKQLSKLSGQYSEAKSKSQASAKSMKKSTKTKVAAEKRIKQAKKKGKANGKNQVAQQVKAALKQMSKATTKFNKLIKSNITSTKREKFIHKKLQATKKRLKWLLGAKKDAIKAIKADQGKNKKLKKKVSRLNKTEKRQQKQEKGAVRKLKQKRKSKGKKVLAAARNKLEKEKVTAVKLASKMKSRSKKTQALEMKAEKMRRKFEIAVARGKQQVADLAQRAKRASTKAKHASDSSKTRAAALKAERSQVAEELLDVEKLKKKSKSLSAKSASLMAKGRFDRQQATTITGSLNSTNKTESPPGMSAKEKGRLQQKAKKLSTKKKLVRVIGQDFKSAEKAEKDALRRLGASDEQIQKAKQKAAAGLKLLNKANRQVQSQNSTTKSMQQHAAKLEKKKKREKGKLKHLQGSDLKIVNAIQTERMALNAAKQRARKARRVLRNGKKDVKKDRKKMSRDAKLAKKDAKKLNQSRQRQNQTDSKTLKKINLLKQKESSVANKLTVGKRKELKVKDALRNSKNATRKADGIVGRANETEKNIASKLKAERKGLRLIKKKQEGELRKRASLRRQRGKVKGKLKKIHAEQADTKGQIKAGGNIAQKVKKVANKDKRALKKRQQADLKLMKTTAEQAKAKLASLQPSLAKMKKLSSKLQRKHARVAKSSEKTKAKIAVNTGKLKNMRKGVKKGAKRLQRASAELNKAKKQEMERALKLKNRKLKEVAAKNAKKVAKDKVRLQNAKLRLLKGPSKSSKAALRNAKKELAKQKTNGKQIVQAESKLLKKEKEDMKKIVVAKKAVKSAEARLRDDERKVKAKPSSKNKVADLQAEQIVDSAKKQQQAANRAEAKLVGLASSKTSKSKPIMKKVEDEAPVCGDGKVQRGEGCDDKNKIKGDGCDSTCHVENGWSCAGGSPSHQSICDKCGNKVVAGQESCDDGNRNNGDGCDSQCNVETGFTCQQRFSMKKSAQISLCKPTANVAQTLVTKLKHGEQKCGRGRIFMMTDIVQGKGTCVMSPNRNDDTVDKEFVDGSALSNPNAVYFNRQNLESCPRDKPMKGSAMLVRCQSTTQTVCLNMGGIRKDRTCSFDRKTLCKEVCVSPRHCRGPGIHGTDLAHISLQKLVKATIRACKLSVDKSEKAFATTYATAPSSKAVESLLQGYDQNKNGALSFAEFLTALQKKPWSALLRSSSMSTSEISNSQVRAVAKGNGALQIIARLQKMFDRFDIDGSLKKKSTFPGGRACCFKHCNTPRSWRRSKASWCWKAALQEALG